MPEQRHEKAAENHQPDCKPCGCGRRTVKGHSYRSYLPRLAPENQEFFSLAPLGERGDRKAVGEGVGINTGTTRQSIKSKSNGKLQ